MIRTTTQHSQTNQDFHFMHGFLNEMQVFDTPRFILLAELLATSLLSELYDSDSAVKVDTDSVGEAMSRLINW